MLGGLVVPVVAVGVFAAAMLPIVVEDITGREVPNEVFLFLVAFFPFVGIQVLDKVLTRLSLRFRRRDAVGNPLEPPMRHSFFFIPLPACSYLWVILVVAVNVWGMLSPITEAEKERTDEMFEEWLEKRE